MKKFLALLLALMMVFSLVACGDKPEEKDPEDNPQVDPVPKEPTANLKYGLAADWNTLSIYSGANTASVNVIADKIFDKLLYYTEDAKWEARNAESWGLDETSTKVIYKLNKNAKWHDGTPVTAQDWVFTFQLMSLQETGYSKPSNMKYFKGTDDNGFVAKAEDLGVSAPDDYTFVCEAKDKIDSLDDFLILTNVIQTHVLPKHILGNLAPADVYKDKYFDAPIGSGPCVFVSQVMNSEVVLKANKDYYLGAPQFATLTFVRVDEATSLATFQSKGDLDLFYPRYNGDSATEAVANADASGYKAVKSSLPAKVLFLMFNNTNVADVRIRQAVQYCIDRDTLVSSMMGDYAIPTTTYITYQNKYKNTNIEYKANLEKAEALVKELGYSKENPLKLKFDTVTGYRGNIAAYIKQECAKVGIEIEVMTTDTPTAFSELQSGKVDMAWILDATYDVNLGGDYYYHANGANFTMVTDPKFDVMMKEIERLQGAGNEEDLKNYMMNWQQYIYDQAVIIPLFFQYSVAAHSSKISNANMFDINYWNDRVWAWTIAN